MILVGREPKNKEAHLKRIENASGVRCRYANSFSSVFCLGIRNQENIYAYNSYYPSNLTPVVSRLLRLSLIYTPQCLGFHRLQSSFKNKIKRKILISGSYERIRCLSNWEYKKYKQIGISEDKLFYCPLGIDYDFFSNIEPSTGTREVFSLANARRFKDIETQVKAINEVLEQYPDAHLDIIGGWEDDNYRREIEDLIVELDIKENVTVHGYIEREKMFEIMSGCEAFVHTSKFETQGLAIYEAAAAGFPICVSEVPVHNQNFERFKHPQGDYEALAEDIKSVFEMEEKEKEEISNEMRELAKGFSYEKEMERLNDFFEVLSNNENIK